jgi:hypothetical protein
MSSADDEGVQDATSESEAAPARASRDDAARESVPRTASIPAAPGATPADLAGRVLGERYSVQGLIGSGAIGRSYLAHDPDGARVVVKLVHASLRSDETFMRRWTRDVEAAAKLEHPHVARVFAQGVDDELGPWVCREFLDGDDLVTALQRGQRTPRRVCELFGQLLNALAEAHRHGVLHQNLKPSNVRLLRDDAGRETLSVCDFANPRRERPGAEYMAPEQASGPVDGQADVYAVGVMLFEVLTEDVPFRGATPRETLSMHRSEMVPVPHEQRPDRPLPRELEAVCLKALAKAPRDRHRSPREMSQALRAVVSLLGARADEVLGSRAFGDGGAPAAALERTTIPGEQLRSRTKFWLGAGLLALVCVGVLMSPEVEPALQRANTAEVRATTREAGALALQSGSARLIAGDAEGAVTDLRNARRALGDTPEVLRALGEALLVEGSSNTREEGVSLLKRYLELEPRAEDRSFVQRLIRHAEGK